MTTLHDQAIDVIVRRKWMETADVAAFDLVAEDGAAPLPPFEAGAHIDVHAPQGGAESALIRQYSLCNIETGQDFYRIAVLRDPQSRGGSAGMHDQLHQGARLRISPPRNHFPLPADTGHAILIAGGIGVTPIMAMAGELDRAGRSFVFHYCVRSLSRAAFLPTIAANAWRGRSLVHADDGPPGQRFDAATVLGAPDHGKHVFVCGPQGLITHVLDVAARLGWPDARVHREFFGAQIAAQHGDQPFVVRLGIDGPAFTVPADRTIADVLAENAVGVPMSCEQGVCGTCLTRVLAGTPDHRDFYLSDAERAANTHMLVCCSRACGPELTLDL